jgi:hypothetical protein
MRDVLARGVQAPQDERQVSLGKSRCRIDHLAGRQRLNPSGEAVACGAELRIRGVVKISQAVSLRLPFPSARL